MSQTISTAAPGWGELYAWQVDRDGGTPLFLQVYGEIRSAILSRRLAPGTRLPSTRALAARLGVSRASVLSAYEQLLAEGYLAGRVGSGTYIASDLTEVPDRPLATRAGTARSAPPPMPPPAKALAAMFAPELQTDGGPFGTGRCSLDARAIAAWRSLSHRMTRAFAPVHLDYSDPRGLLELRETICEYVRAARAVRCEPDQVMVTAGAQHAVDIAIRVLLGRGDEVWVEDPAYRLTVGALAAAGVHRRPLPVDAHGLDVRAGIRTAPRARAAFVTPSHQYPLGVVLSMARRLELLAWAREAGAWIVEDDYDSEFRYSGRPLASLQGLDDGARTLYIGTFNKVLFPGLRLGYAVVPRSLLPAFINARTLIDRHPPSLDQMVLAAFMRRGHFVAHLRRVRLLYREQRDTLVAELGRTLGERVTLDAPGQGKHLVVFLCDGVPDVAVEAAARARGVLVRAISPMYQRARPRSGLLLGFTGFSREAMVSAVGGLRAAIDDVRGRRGAAPSRRTGQRKLE
jgi:GntR family transcriptional regulator/MocR family aminotransferase